jgi:hypothetical protein
LSPLDALVRVYGSWCQKEGLHLGSALEHLHDEALTDAQRRWLADFVRRWEDAIARDRQEIER